MSFLPDETLDHLRRVASVPDLSATKYRIARTLGRGGMGTVYLAWDQELYREVALKVLDVPDPGGRLAARMWSEARIVARLEHPGIVPIHDVGMLPDDRVFYAMKYVKGERLDQYAPENLADRLRVFQKVCEAVAFAHAQGVIHRDLKPENIMVGAFGEVLVMDWGLAKVLHEKGVDSSLQEESRHRVSTLTDHGIVMGTPAYMAPEQTSGARNLLNERTDVYALGSILYFLLTGMPPFESGSVDSAARHFREMPLISPRRRNSKIGRSIEAVCLKAMSPQQDLRYPDALELAQDVARYLEGSSVSAYRENPLEMMQRWVRRNYFVVLLILSYLIMRVLLLLLAGR